MTTMHARLALAALAAILFAGGCAPGTEPGTGPTAPVDWDTTLDLGVPGAVIETAADVEFYPACGNEILAWGDAQYYPFAPANLDDFPDTAVPPAAALGADHEVGFARFSVPVSLPTVVAPGPGDDVGSLVVYEGGFAHWSSDSGSLSTWLTTTPIDYMWVC